MKDSIQHNWPWSDTVSSRQVSTGSTRCRRSTCAVQQAVGSVDHHAAALPLLCVIASARLHSTNQKRIINLCISEQRLARCRSFQFSRRLMRASMIDPTPLFERCGLDLTTSVAWWVDIFHASGVGSKYLRLKVLI